MNNIRKTSSAYFWFLLLLVFFIVNFLASVFHTRVDLTGDGRFTISKAGREILENLEETVQVDLFIEGKSLPSEVRRYRNALDEFLNHCMNISGGNLQYRFLNPYKDLNDSLQRRMEDSLDYFYGLFPSVLDAPEQVGDKLEISKVIHGAVLRYRDTAAGINFIRGIRSYGTGKEQRAALYNDMEALMEYQLLSGVQKITTEKKPVIGYLLGNGEAFGYNINDAFLTLREEYFTDTINLKQVPYIPEAIDALVIIKPTKPFNDEDKLKLDQYVMRGGHIFWMIDNMHAEFDSLRNAEGFIAYDRGLDIEDIMFKYGVRINQNLLQDMQCDKLGQISSNPENPQMRLVDWPFFPVLNGTAHPISKNLDGIRAMFPNTLDTVKSEGIKKTFLLRSSPNARVLAAPARVDFEFLQIAPDISLFNVRDTAVAVLLEGKFRSLFTSRLSGARLDSLVTLNRPFLNAGERNAKIIVVADGDIALNQISPQSGPMPMGYNFYTQHTFSNREFFINALEYLVNPTGILETRAREFRLRLLDLKKVKGEKSKWQLLNLALPLMITLIAGFLLYYLRKRKYAV